MKLEKKRALAARALHISEKRIRFNINRLDEIKKAITKQDVKDLAAKGAITIKETKGRRKIKIRKTRKRGGKIKKKVSKRKQEYVTLTRKLRAYLAHARSRGIISSDAYREFRRRIREKEFKSLAHMKERLAQKAE